MYTAADISVYTADILVYYKPIFMYIRRIFMYMGDSTDLEAFGGFIYFYLESLKITIICRT